MDDKTRAAMKKSIQNNGFMNPVTIKPDGTLVDGYHRHKIWIELLSEGLPGLKLPYCIRKFRDEEEVTKFLEDMNKHRRHLDIFSAVKAALEELPGAEEEARRKRYEAHSATLRGDEPTGEDIQGRTLAQVAKRHRVSESTVKYAKRIKDSEHDDIKEAVLEKGEMPIRAGYQEVVKRDAKKKKAETQGTKQPRPFRK